MIESQKSTLVEIASDDRLFLKYDAQCALGGKSHAQLAGILESCTYAIKILKATTGSRARYVGRQRKSTIAWSARSLSGPALANLMHLLLCLQQAAIHGLILLSFNIFEAEILRRRDSWEQVMRFENGRFSEWPSGQRPLSTSWPWNIRPSLVILWGVCWMFYDHDNSTRDRTQRGGEVSSAALWGGIAAPQQMQSHHPRKCHPDSHGSSVLMINTRLYTSCEHLARP